MPNDESIARDLMRSATKEFWDFESPMTPELSLVVWRPIFKDKSLETVFTSIEENNLSMDIGDGVAGMVAETLQPFCGSLSDSTKVQHIKIVNKYKWINAQIYPVIVNKILIGICGIYSTKREGIIQSIVDRIISRVTCGLFMIDIAVNSRVRDQSLDRSLLMLEIAKAAEDRFHDIKEALFSASGALGGLKNNKSNSSQFDRDISILQRQIEKATGHALRFIKESKNPNRLDRSDFDICTIVRNIKSDLESRAKSRASQHKRKIDVHYNEPIGSIIINGDVERLYRAISNIVHNAEYWVVHSINGVVRIDINLISDDDFCYLKVLDTGPGIIDTQRALEKGYSMKDGTGLGLCIAKKVIDLHDGALEIKSNPPNWTMVELTLPLRV